MGRRLTGARAWAALCALSLVACASRGVDRAAPDTVRVLTWNIHAGRGTDGLLDVERIAAVIQAADPDLVALQEVDRGTERAGRRDLAAEIGRLTGLEPVFGPNLEFQGGDFGNVILSRLPLRDVANHRMPVFDNGEPRGALVATVAAPGGAFLFIATHLDHRPADVERLASLARIDSIARGSTAVLAGDLNDVPGSATLRLVQARWTVTGTGRATFPAAAPDRRIDYIAYRPAGAWRVESERVLEEAVASDHRPVLAVLRRLK